MRERGDPVSTVLIVDDSAAQRCALERGLTRSSLRIDGIRTTSTAVGALELLEHETFDLVMCDASLPDREGIDLLEAIASSCENTACILLTCLEQRELVETARARGIKGALRRPFDHEHLVNTVEGAIGGEH